MLSPLTLRGLLKVQELRDKEAEQDFAKAVELDPKLKPTVEDGAKEIRQRRDAQAKP